MREAVIVSTARTPIGRAYRGAFNDTHGATLELDSGPAGAGLAVSVRFRSVPSEKP